ncbi:host specificity protein [bacterium]|nr:host specificity protein [bacterium]
MATILLSAAGAAIGSGFGGTVLGLSGAVIGRAVGATIGRSIDQRILGAGSEPIETGRVERFQLTGASDGAPIARVWGRMRLAGQVIWATRFLETANRSGGGKGSPRPAVTSFSYSVSLAIALCQGEVQRLGRIWADGIEIPVGNLDLRFYPGDEAQLPDPKIEAVEGAGLAPSYRGIAYVVIEDLDLSRFGNRIPQFTFEVIRRCEDAITGAIGDIASAVQAVALIPGTGEYALATKPVTFSDGPGVSRSANVHTIEDRTDFSMSLKQLSEELPNCGSVSLVVSWFGNDLRCNQCTVRPKVDQSSEDGVEMPWRVAGLDRSTAEVLPQLDGRAVYGGSPADQSVIESITAIRASGKEVMFYPFILMEQLDGNGLADPWTGGTGQPALPWRGRITLSVAPGQPGSPDQTGVAEGEVAAFIGTAQLSDFSISDGRVVYSGPEEWSFRRFILHYAHLCTLAGGVDAFCIGSELRGLTQIRGIGDSFPMVLALKSLAADVRAILGAGTKISYAADWSEYAGYQQDGNLYFHLDPLWADANIDFIGIDNYMPLSDWRDGTDHLDNGWGSIYNVEYLKANIAGGEWYDWYYDSPLGAESQLRRPIQDLQYGEDWVYRTKDIAGWWGHAHHNRSGGTRLATATEWIAGSKPVRFTEYGCAALDKGTNEPNKFIDTKSSESALPRASNGRRDDLIQMQYLRAMHEFWSQDANNPAGLTYAGRMVDLAHSHVWAWDARPFPEFPGNDSVWGDGGNYSRGHWLNGRSSGQPLAAVVADICADAGVGDSVDVSETYGVVRGYLLADSSTARASLQPLMTSFAVEARERDGSLRFTIRDGIPIASFAKDRLALVREIDGGLETLRSSQADVSGRVRLTYVEAESDFEVRTAEAVFPDETSVAVTQNEVTLQLTNSEARGVVERWLVESRFARDGARFALPKSALNLGAGDVIDVEGVGYRIDRLELGDVLLIDAVRTEPGAYLPSDDIEFATSRPSPAVAMSIFPLFLDLPLLTGSDDPQAPHVAAVANPWPGAVGVWSSASDSGFSLNRQMDVPAILGVTQTAMRLCGAGIWDAGPALRVRLSTGQLSSVSQDEVLNGANAAAIGDGTPENWEVFQFARAELVAPRTYDLTLRLRGQAGTDGVMPQEWPVGSYFVLLDRAVPQIDLAASARGLERNYRVGQIDRGYSDPRVVSATLAFDGVGLRPYSVSHLEVTGRLGATIAASWIRRTRIDGDSWQGLDVPLGEDAELYEVQIRQGTTVLRDEFVATPAWSYTPVMQAQDGAAAGFTLAVAQVSGRFGPGPFNSAILG